MDLEKVFNEEKTFTVNSDFFLIIFLEETWIEVYNDDKTHVRSCLFNITDRIDFEFRTQIGDYFTKSENHSGFQNFFKR